MEILFLSKATHTISGIVYRINTPDSENDVVEDIEVLRQGSHSLMKEYAKGRDVFNVDHDSRHPLEGIIIEESFVTGKDETIIKKGVEIPPGCWYISLKIPSRLWPLLSKSRGFSMEGVGDGVAR